MWGRYGRDAGEVRARYGLGIGEVWSRYGRDMGEIWARCARDVGGIWARYGRGADEMWGSLRTGAPVAAAAIPEYKSSTVYELVLRRCASSCPAWWLSRSRSVRVPPRPPRHPRHPRHPRQPRLLDARDSRGASRFACRAVEHLTAAPAPAAAPPPVGPPACRERSAHRPVGEVAAVHFVNGRLYLRLLALISVYVALTNIPEGELLTGFAMRSDPNVAFG